MAVFRGMSWEGGWKTGKNAVFDGVGRVPFWAVMVAVAGRWACWGSGSVGMGGLFCAWYVCMEVEAVV